MRVARSARRNDFVGLTALAALLLLGWLFRSSPIDFLAPGFPILRQTDWTAEMVARFEILRRTPLNVSSQIAYLSVFTLLDETLPIVVSTSPTGERPSSYSGNQVVTWFADPADALAELREAHTTYVTELNPSSLLITDIPGLSFTSQADQYYLECEQLERAGTAFVPDESYGCAYWAVYGNYYSHLILDSGYHDHFMPTVLLSELLNRADAKLWEAAN